MMSVNIAPQVPTIVQGETRNFAVSFVNILDSEEVLTGTPAVVDENATGGLTISNKAINTTALTICDRAAAVGQAVQFRVAGQTAAKSPYTLKITVTTSGGQTKIAAVRFNVEIV
jgi:hypothetical protein